ncbi:EGF domain-specific O-linked N-acetylglucosamine transferase isoform X2 [Ixodes scapularis]|uniref:EGF domain-specific O-linked N-acetylglucosamine transferase isoform X2 n=1 Tax=Ixodes scapularis TaxID=6945 RepID=UPI001C391938|nr:EGF domain-specific O-linked N-acetylglucosamine transferase isoform X2 [Ixodes scapularis]
MTAILSRDGPVPAWKRQKKKTKDVHRTPKPSKLQVTGYFSKLPTTERTFMMARFTLGFTLAVITGRMFATVVATERRPYDVQLPDEHMAHFFYGHPAARQSCIEDPACPYKKQANASVCWGYELGCDRRSEPATCPGSANGWAEGKEAQLNLFFDQGDFGFIRERRKTLSLLCRPEQPGDSLLECVRHMELCRAKNIRMDFERLVGMPEPMKYREDVLGPGLVGGRCRLDGASLRLEGGRKSPLQSWYAELGHFEELPSVPSGEDGCDVVLERPTVVMKLDATPIQGQLCAHVAGVHRRRTEDPVGVEGPQGKSRHPARLPARVSVVSPQVCFREALFAFLPRMIFGLYYNMPLVPGCSGSGLFRAFNRHVLHRFGVTAKPPDGDIRVTLLSRKTKHRRIVNEQELVAAARSLPGVRVRLVDFGHSTDFMHQLEVTANTDVLIGMHGAGLTHVLFQPDWGVLFEIFNCEDPGCYLDLARLRGVEYVTWEAADKLHPEDEGHHPTLGAHAKFTNYRFDVGEFLRLLRKAVDHVQASRPRSRAPSRSSSVVHDEM